MLCEGERIKGVEPHNMTTMFGMVTCALRSGLTFP